MSANQLDLADLRRIAARILLGLVVTCALLYLGDYALWRIKLAHGSGVGTVHVSRFVVAALKGNKEEYYFDGSEDVDCSQSLFGHTGAGSCWYVQRHRVIYAR